MDDRKTFYVLLVISVFFLFSILLILDYNTFNYAKIEKLENEVYNILAEEEENKITVTKVNSNGIVKEKDIYTLENENITNLNVNIYHISKIAAFKNKRNIINKYNCKVTLNKHIISLNTSTNLKTREDILKYLEEYENANKPKVINNIEKK